MFKKIFKLFVCTLLLGFLASNLSYVQASGLNAGIVDSDFPKTLIPGQDYLVTITMVNNGDDDWIKSENFYLKLFNGFNNEFGSDVWSINRVELPQDVYSEDKVTFLFKITAPKTNGTYNIQWAMAKDLVFFGEFTNNIISVGGEFVSPVLDDNENNSEFIGSNIPETMNAGEKYKVGITMKNTGKTEWSSTSSNDGYKIAPVIESSDVTYLQWNSESNYLPSAVQPGQTINIEFYVTAPSDSGNYTQQWIMKKGDNSFGQKSTTVTVSVPGNNNKYTDTKIYNASLIQQSVPITMTLNKTQDIYITLRNTGSKTWIRGNEQLVMIDAKKDLVTLNSWNVGYIQLLENVEPGGVVTFNFQVKPSETGWNYFQCSMMKSDGTLFGNPSQSVEVSVAN